MPLLLRTVDLQCKEKRISIFELCQFCKMLSVCHSFVCRFVFPPHAEYSLRII